MLRLLLAGIGLTYVVAFLSLVVQVEGLVGSHGILPNERFFASMEQRAAFADAPSLCWGDGCSDATLVALCLVGAAAGGLLLLGFAPLPAACVAWVAYLSLFYAGQLFLGFQWDLLLLEIGFLALLAAPPSALTPHSAAWRRAPPRVPLWLFRWLLFRLVFASGVVKLSSGDPTWRDLSAMAFHYETQPIPFLTSWWAHQLPDAVQRASTAVALATELLAPWLFFGTRRTRQLGAAAVFALMLLIAGTGNYGFFNLLGAVLCLSLLDDDVLPLWLRRMTIGGEGQGGGETALATPASRRMPRTLRPLAIAAVALFVFASSLAPLLSAFRLPSPALAPIGRAYALQRGFRVTSPYGLFARMTTSRPEILVEGSVDGRSWQAYRFPFKPGDPARAPRFAGPHMPRLDWQLWFAALRGPERSGWFRLFAQRLLEGEPAVLALLEKNPFPDEPPRFVRAVVRDYRFTDPAIRRKTGDWWQAGPPRVALTVSLRAEQP